MKLSEVGQLLTVISMFDNRKLDAEGVQAEVWFELDFIRDADFGLAKAAVVLFFSQPPNDRGELPYLDPRWLRYYMKAARRNRDVDAARANAMKALPPGRPAKMPENFREQVAASAAEAKAWLANLRKGTAEPFRVPE